MQKKPSAEEILPPEAFSLDLEGIDLESNEE
jgi:hypothetical protein